MFLSCPSISQVVLVEGLTVISAQIFNVESGNTLLSSITIPSTLTHIGKD